MVTAAQQISEVDMACQRASVDADHAKTTKAGLAAECDIIRSVFELSTFRAVLFALRCDQRLCARRPALPQGDERTAFRKEGGGMPGFPARARTLSHSATT
jgi:hypothetical protein